MPDAQQSDESSIAPRLGLWDAVSIIVGIVVGTAIFRSSTAVFQNVAGPWWAMGVWLAGGVLSLCGAVCYAELATTYPRDGGDYEYLGRAFGPWCGFLFGWAQLTSVISGNIAIMAYAFADYGVRLWPGWKEQAIWLTVAPVVALSMVNACGIGAGKFAQNLLSLVKVAGLVAVVIAGVAATGATPQTALGAEGQGGGGGSLGLALVFVLYAYGGWAHAPFVAAEVRDQRRNMPRALVLGILGIAAIYLAVNAAYLHVLGFEGARQTATPAADVLEAAAGAWGSRAISVLVMLSALGAINGMILTGSRVYAVWGADYPALHWLGTWNRAHATPRIAIAVQAIVAAVLIVLVGTASGKNFCDAVLGAVGLSALPWEKFSGGFEMLVTGSAPVFWGLCALTGIAVFVLRVKDRGIERPYAIPLYPLPPLVFVLTCCAMVWSSANYAGWLVLLGVVPLAAGAALATVVRRRGAGEVGRAV